MGSGFGGEPFESGGIPRSSKQSKTRPLEARVRAAQRDFFNPRVAEIPKPCVPGAHFISKQEKTNA